MTINFWVRSDDAGNIFVAKDSIFDIERAFDILSTGIVIQQYFFASTGSLTLEPSASIDDGEWHMITCLFEANDCRTYLDGSQIASQDPFLDNSWAGAGNDLSVGARYRNSDDDFDSPLLGDMAKIGIWSRLLTEDEITELYNGGIGLLYAQI
jgi:hypothetical protein